jgi:serine phosphatase RsbU (regulator of sigma subunit)
MKKPDISASRFDEINCRLWKSHYEDTSGVLAEAKSILAKVQKANYHKGVAYARLNIAVCCFLQSKNDLALENLSESLAWFAENSSESGYSCALNLKSNLYESFGEYEKALQFCLQANKLATEKHDQEMEAETSSQLGMIYSRLCNFTKALEYYHEGLRIREEMNDENAMASSLNRIGMIMRLTKKHHESLEYYKKSLEIRRKNNQITSIPWTMLGLASTYEEMHKTTEALDYYHQGMIDADKRCTLQCLMGIGRIYSQLGKAEKAEEKLLESLRIAQDLRAQSLVADAQAALANHYETTGQVDKALESYKHYQKTRESVKSDEAQSRFRNIEISHAIEKSEKEKEIYRLRHVELKKAYDIIEEKNLYINASINYASRIQRAILPDTSELKGHFPDSFFLYSPLDIISGDFYWFSLINNKLVLVAADCTGHGVPGALMSMLGISFLEEIVNNMEITDSGLILDELSSKVIKALHQKGAREDTKDGMDISLCVIDKKLNSIQFSGAHNNLYLIRNKELTEYKADWIPIGYSYEKDERFSKQEIRIAPGDIIYMYSDGYADQFGGPDRKKFNYARLKSLLLQIHHLPMDEQHERLSREFHKWKGNEPQTDDVMIIGMKM